MRCEECGTRAPDAAADWRAYRGDPAEDEESLVVFYCPACAEREFGPPGVERDAGSAG